MIEEWNVFLYFSDLIPRLRGISFFEPGLVPYTRTLVELKIKLQRGCVLRSVRGIREILEPSVSLRQLPRTINNTFSALMEDTSTDDHFTEDDHLQTHHLLVTGALVVLLILLPNLCCTSIRKEKKD